jgi:hypothetical protein
LINSVYTGDDNNDGIIDRKENTTNSYDKKGNLINSVFEDDFNANGIVDFRNILNKAYNSQGILISSVSEGDFGVDGIIDYIDAQFYNDQGKKISALEAFDYNGDGVFDTKTTYTFTYTDNLIGTGDCQTFVVGSDSSSLVVNNSPVSKIITDYSSDIPSLAKLKVDFKSFDFTGTDRIALLGIATENQEPFGNEQFIKEQTLVNVVGIGTPTFAL